uniref:Protein quiver n=1 Tax=Steinernema glaseri TaxID=37863 RepID=A0A1I7YSE3_9BILA
MKSLLLLLALLVLAANAESHNRCYKCASYHVIMYWENYFGAVNDMESVVEDSCVNETTIHNVVNCKGSCLTLNITSTTRAGTPYVAGVLRGCETNFWRKPTELEGDDKKCTVRNKKYRGKTYDAEFCFCRGDHCNGPKPESAEYKKAARSQKRPYHRRGYANSLATPTLLMPALYILRWL